MPLDLTLQEPRPAPVSQAELQRVLDRVWRAERTAGPETTRPWALTVRVTDDQEMRQLNRAFRGVDASTDVLSFGYADPCEDSVLRDVPAAQGMLGDLILSRPYIARIAAQAGTALADEFILCAVHGLLHLMGMDHATPTQAEAMFQRQDRWVRALGYAPRPTWPLPPAGEETAGDQILA